MNILKTPTTTQRWTRPLTLIALCLVGAVSLGISAFSLQVATSNAPNDLHRFVGTWEAKYEGQVFFRLKLKPKGGGLTGTCFHAKQLAWVNGEIIPSTQESTEDRVVQAQVSSSKAVLRIGNTDPIPLELTRTGDSESEGRIVADSSQVPPQKKPWHFQRVADDR